jgi:hypothetical protein
MDIKTSTKPFDLDSLDFAVSSLGFTVLVAARPMLLAC